MSSVEIFVSIFGVFLGYWIFGSFLGNASKKPPQAPTEPTGEDSRQSQAGAGLFATDAALPWYEVLGVPMNADLERIQSAYRERIGKYHPDKVASLGEELQQLAQAKSKEINRAYHEALQHVGQQG